MKNLTVRSAVILAFVVGSFVLAILDDQFRTIFGDLAKVCVGGYFGQLVPQAKN